MHRSPPRQAERSQFENYYLRLLDPLQSVLPAPRPRTVCCVRLLDGVGIIHTYIYHTYTAIGSLLFTSICLFEYDTIPGPWQQSAFMQNLFIIEYMKQSYVITTLVTLNKRCRRRLVTPHLTLLSIVLSLRHLLKSPTVPDRLHVIFLDMSGTYIRTYIMGSIKNSVDFRRLSPKELMIVLSCWMDNNGRGNPNGSAEVPYP